MFLNPLGPMSNTLATSHLQIVGADHPQWDAYVAQHPQGSIFHSSGVLRAYEASQDLQPYAQAAVDSQDRIVALLVGCQVKTLQQMTSFTSRAVQFAEPLCEADVVGRAGLAKLIRLFDSHMRSRTLMSEIRALQEPGVEREILVEHGHEHRDYINYIVDLKKSPDELWQAVNKNLRQKIRGTLRKGIEVRDDQSIAGVGRFYDLLICSYGRARVPLAGRDFFEAVLHHLPKDHVRLRTAFDGEKPIASILSLLFGSRVFSWYGGTLRLNGLSPFACIVWDDIQWGCEQGYAIYDFGGAGWPHEDYGPRKFKASFGSQEVRFGRYIKTYSKFRLKLAELGYQASRRLGVWSTKPPEITSLQCPTIPPRNRHHWGLG